MLNFFEDAGVSLSLDADRLKVGGLKQLPPGQAQKIREKIKTHRTEIMRELSKKQISTLNDGRFIVTDDLEPHDVAGIVPEFEGEGFDKFKADIEAKGQLVPIVLFQGKIIDGRARYRACKELDRPVIARQWEGGMDPVDYILAVNVLRGQELPPDIPAPEPPGMGSEYADLWNRAWTLADWIDDPAAAPIEARRAKLPELDDLRQRMATIERQSAPTAGPEPETSPADTWHTWESTDTATRDRTPENCPARCRRTGKCYAAAYFKGNPGRAKDCEPETCKHIANERGHHDSQTT